MWIHEYQAKELLLQYGILALSGIAVFTVQEAIEAAQKLGGRAWSVKVQSHVCEVRQQKKVVTSLNELEKQVFFYLETPRVYSRMNEHVTRVRRLLIEEIATIAGEYVFAILLDSQSRRLVFRLSYQCTPYQIKEIEIDPLCGLSVEDVRLFVAQAELPIQHTEEMIMLCYQLCAAFMSTDALSIEGRLVWVKERERLEVADVCALFDDCALFRHPEISIFRDLDEESPHELEATLHGIVYKGLAGSIGCLSNGGGLGLIVLDTLRHFGGAPANLVDIDGALTVEKAHAALELIYSSSNLRVVIINIVAEVHRCNIIAENIVRAYRAIGVYKPLVVRLKGEGEGEAKCIFEASGLPVYWVSNFKGLIECAILLSE